MNEKKTPIIRSTRIAWARFEKVDCTTGRKRTRLVQQWKMTDGSIRLYFGRKRVIDCLTFQYVCFHLTAMGWTRVQMGC